jgi:hypothetical protein
MSVMLQTLVHVSHTNNDTITKMNGQMTQLTSMFFATTQSIQILDQNVLHLNNQVVNVNQRLTEFERKFEKKFEKKVEKKLGKQKRKSIERVDKVKVNKIDKSKACLAITHEPLNACKKNCVDVKQSPSYGGKVFKTSKSPAQVQTQKTGPRLNGQDVVTISTMSGVCSVSSVSQMQMQRLSIPPKTPKTPKTTPKTPVISFERVMESAKMANNFPSVPMAPITPKALKTLEVSVTSSMLPLQQQPLQQPSSPPSSPLGDFSFDLELPISELNGCNSSSSLIGSTGATMSTAFDESTIESDLFTEFPLSPMTSMTSIPGASLAMENVKAIAKSQLMHSSSTLSYVQRACLIPFPKKNQCVELDPSKHERWLHILLIMSMMKFCDTSISHFDFHPFQGEKGMVNIGFFPYSLHHTMSLFARFHYHLQFKVGDVQEYLGRLVGDEKDIDVKDYSDAFEAVSPCRVVHRGKSAAEESTKRRATHGTFLNNLSRSVMIVSEQRICEIPEACFLEAKKNMDEHWSVEKLREALPPRREVSQRDLTLKKELNHKDFPWLRIPKEIVDSNERKIKMVYPYPSSQQSLTHPKLDYKSFFTGRLYKKLYLSPNWMQWGRFHYTYQARPLYDFQVTPYKVLHDAVKLEEWMLHCRVGKPKVPKKVPKGPKGPKTGRKRKLNQ